MYIFFAELRVQKSALRLREYRGCTLGFRIFFADVRVQKLACGLRKQPYYYGNRIFYHEFPAMDSGSFMLRFRQKKSRFFGSGGPKSIATPNPSHNNILFYILSYTTKKNISELRLNWWSFVLTGTSTSRRVNGWRGKLSIPFLAWLPNGG